MTTDNYSFQGRRCNYFCPVFLSVSCTCESCLQRAKTRMLLHVGQFLTGELLPAHSLLGLWRNEYIACFPPPISVSLACEITICVVHASLFQTERPNPTPQSHSLPLQPMNFFRFFSRVPLSNLLPNLNLLITFKWNQLELLVRPCGKRGASYIILKSVRFVCEVL